MVYVKDLFNDGSPTAVVYLSEMYPLTASDINNILTISELHSSDSIFVALPYSPPDDFLTSFFKKDFVIKESRVPLIGFQYAQWCLNPLLAMGLPYTSYIAGVVPLSDLFLEDSPVIRDFSKLVIYVAASSRHNNRINRKLDALPDIINSKHIDILTLSCDATNDRREAVIGAVEEAHYLSLTGQLPSNDSEKARSFEAYIKSLIGNELVAARYMAGFKPRIDFAIVPDESLLDRFIEEHKNRTIRSLKDILLECNIEGGDATAALKNWDNDMESLKRLFHSIDWVQLMSSVAGDFNFIHSSKKLTVSTPELRMFLNTSMFPPEFFAAFNFLYVRRKEDAANRMQLAPYFFDEAIVVKEA